MFLFFCFVYRDGNYAANVGDLFSEMKQSKLSAVFRKLASEAEVPPHNLASVLLSLAEYCMKAKLTDDCIRACRKVINIGNGQQRECAKSILLQVQH